MKTSIIVTLLLSISLFSISAETNRDLALQTIQKLGKSLKQELKKGMKKSPVEAVKICNLKAPQIRDQINGSNKASGNGQKIEVGRVSLKNRNPNNRPEDWMLPYIEKFHKGEIKEKFITHRFDDKKRGLIMPIKTMPLCLNCHGTKISKAVRSEIQRLYPKDKATDYKVGDIRGFFWAKY